MAEASGKRPLSVQELAASMRRRDDVEAVYPYPTDSQRYPGCRLPALSADGEARLRAMLAELRASRGLAPHPADRTGDAEESEWL